MILFKREKSLLAFLVTIELFLLLVGTISSFGIYFMSSKKTALGNFSFNATYSHKCMILILPI